MGLSVGNAFFMQPSALARGIQNGSTPQNGQNAGDLRANPSIPMKASACSHCGGAHGADFDHMATLAAGKNPATEFAAFKARQYSEIMAHEQAHASAAGSLGGRIHIQFDGNGVAVAGHVPISIPGMDRQNPEVSYKNYNTVRSAALAPGDPSGQDMSVASKAQALMGQAQVLMSQKKQAQSAGVSLDTFQKAGGNPQALARFKKQSIS